MKTIVFFIFFRYKENQKYLFYPSVTRMGVYGRFPSIYITMLKLEDRGLPMSQWAARNTYVQALIIRV